MGFVCMFEDTMMIRLSQKSLWCNFSDQFFLHQLNEIMRELCHEATVSNAVFLILGIY